VVDVRPQRDLAREHTVPVEVTVEPRKKHRFSLGLGYGTDTGPRGTLAWKNRRLNRRGHQVQSALELSGIRNSLLAAYEIPLKRPVTDRFAAQAGYRTEDTETSDSETLSIGVRRTRLRPGDWLETLSLDYQAEDFTVGDTARRSIMLIPGVSWARTRADNPVTPTRGSRWLLEFRGAETALGSDTDLLQTRLQGKFIRSLGQNQRLLLRGDLGLSYVSDFDALPATMRFFAGGDQSVRGYALTASAPRTRAAR
jgi:translocation and assembly module TamA